MLCFRARGWKPRINLLKQPSSKKVSQKSRSKELKRQNRITKPTECMKFAVLLSKSCLLYFFPVLCSWTFCKCQLMTSLFQSQTISVIPPLCYWRHSSILITDLFHNYMWTSLNFLLFPFFFFFLPSGTILLLNKPVASSPEWNTIISKFLSFLFKLVLLVKTYIIPSKQLAE